MMTNAEIDSRLAAIEEDIASLAIICQVLADHTHALHFSSLVEEQEVLPNGAVADVTLHTLLNRVLDKFWKLKEGEAWRFERK